MRGVCLMLARFSTVAWVGAALLFIVTSIAEQTARFPSEVNNQLALVRFPYYYGFGFSLVTLALAAVVLGRNHPGLSAGRLWAFCGLTIAALAMMLADYAWIYRPLAEMLQPAGAAKPAEFVSYHEASKYVNFIDVAVCLVAGLVICWPLPMESPAAKDDG